MTVKLDARNADLPEIVSILQDQRARRCDLVVSAAAVSAMDGNLVIADTEATQLVSEDGVTKTAGAYRPTSTCDEGIGVRLDIHGGYLKKLRDLGRVDIWDANVNGMLHGGASALAPAPDYVFPPFSRGILLRLLKGDDGETGVARACMSPSYKFIDNLDVLMAVMAGIQQAGVDARPGSCDLSDRRMFARFDVPELAALAPNLLKGYRNPFDGPGAVKRAGEDTPGGMRLRSEYGNWSPDAALRAAHAEGQGYEPGKEPVVWAGLVVSNSDVGGGARWIIPQIRVQVCKNGLSLIAEADKQVHLGSVQNEGVIEWSAATMEKELQLITAQATDVVRTFLTPEYFQGQVQRIEALAAAPVKNAEVTVREVTKAAGFTKAEQDGILAHFLRGGTYTAGGAANAVTSYSQTIASPDRAAELDRAAIKVLEHAARLA